MKLFGRVHPRVYRDASLIALAFACPKTWVLYSDGKADTLLKAVLYFVGAFLILFIPLLVAFIILSPFQKQHSDKHRHSQTKRID
jgi:hypothetical protein